MARIRFIADYDYSPVHGVTIAYKAGMVETVKRECADRAIAAGRGEEVVEAAPAVADEGEAVDG